ncbi:leucine-rich_repeat domain-containing protein [Hexamita inflata]|uniref:Leucine-rich repeat domain-containing protein n=1 Tax=Hexamita inflata TaxID=28002 RepID=A0AA86UD19_9EUKA|nr:leucine-rich repeat domain-containing protein [Hexamita inflata]
MQPNLEHQNQTSDAINSGQVPELYYKYRYRTNPKRQPDAKQSSLNNQSLENKSNDQLNDMTNSEHVPEICYKYRYHSNHKMQPDTKMQYSSKQPIHEKTNNKNPGDTAKSEVLETEPEFSKAKRFQERSNPKPNRKYSNVKDYGVTGKKELENIQVHVNTKLSADQKEFNDKATFDKINSITPIKCDVPKIPDDLSEYDKEVLGKYQDKIKNGELSIDQIDRDTDLTCLDLIRFLNINRLSLLSNSLIISKLESNIIRKLYIYDCEIQSFKDFNLENLEALEIYNQKNRTQFALEIIKFQKLKRLFVYHYAFDVSPLSKMTGLTKLTLDYCELRNTEALIPLVNLVELNLSQNHGIDITALQHLTNLIVLTLTYCKLVSFDALVTLKKLEELDISSNNIVYLQPLEQLKSLVDLDATFNNIIEYKSVHHQNFMNFQLGNQKKPSKEQIEAANIQRNIDSTIISRLLIHKKSSEVNATFQPTKMQPDIKVQYNSRQPRSVYANAQIQSEQKESNEKASHDKIQTRKQVIKSELQDMPHNLSKYDKEMIQKYQSLMEDETLIIKKHHTFKSMNFIRYLKITKLVLNSWKNKVPEQLFSNTIKQLEITDSEIFTLQDFQLANLEKLQIKKDNQDIFEFNTLAQDILRFQTLKELYLNNWKRQNRIYLFSQHTGITKLVLTFCDLRSFEDLRPLANLEALDVIGNESELDLTPLRHLTKLTGLQLYKFKLVNIDALKHLKLQLKELDLCENNEINITSLQYLTQLTKLSLGYNKVVSLDVLRPLTNLVELHIYANNIVYLQPIMELKQLQKFTTRSNYIIDVDSIQHHPNFKRFELDNEYNPNSIQIKQANILRSINSPITSLKLMHKQNSKVKSQKMKMTECIFKQTKSHQQLIARVASLLQQMNAIECCQ